MKVSSGPVSKEVAMSAADELETVLSEIANGKRKPHKIPIEPMVRLIQFARDTRPAKDWISFIDGGYVVVSRSNWAHSNGESGLEASRKLLEGMDGDLIAHMPASAYKDIEHLKIMLGNSGGPNVGS